MTVQELYELLEDVLKKLDDANIDDESKIDLEILVLQLKRQIIVASFDPLKDLEKVTVANVSKLRQLTAEVGREIENEQKRVQLVQQIITIAKMALKAGGVPIPS